MFKVIRIPLLFTCKLVTLNLRENYILSYHKKQEIIMYMRLYVCWISVGISL